MDEDNDDKYIVRGPEYLEEIPNESFGKMSHRYLQNNYQLPIALIDPATRRITSYKTLFENTSRLAYSLQNLGVTKNDVIAISSENHMQYAFPLFAALWMGTTVTLYNPQYTPREVTHVINISKPTVIFCSKSSLQQIIQARRGLNHVKKVIVIDGIDTEEDAESLEIFVSRNSSGYRSFTPVDVDPQRVAIILYSSGTTGLPKGVMMSHCNLNICFSHMRDPRYFPQRIPGTSTSLCLMPLFHGFGILIFASALFDGKMLLVVSKFEATSYLKMVQDYKVKTLYIVPPIANFLANSRLTDDYDVSHVEVITSGAAPLSKNVVEQLLQKFKNVSDIRQGYGMTENTIVISIAPLGFSKNGSVGKLVPGVIAKIVDVDSGRSNETGREGEIYVGGPQVMIGYAGDINSTKLAIDKQGWLKTGDVGYYDEDGHFYIVGRTKDLIKYKGFQVAPAELEDLLLQHPDIIDAAVIGIPDEIAGEVPMAFVVAAPGRRLTEDDIKSFIAGQVAPHKQLRGGVRIVEEIPKSAAGKIMKNQLRQLFTQRSKL